MLSCSPIPNSTYNAYITANIVIIDGISILAFAVIMLYQCYLHGQKYGNLFYYLIDTLFHIRQKEGEEKKKKKDEEEEKEEEEEVEKEQVQGNNSNSSGTPEYEEPLYFFDSKIKSSRRRTVMLLLITVFTIASSLAVFFEGIFLTNEFLKPNSNCPYTYDTLDCFGYQSRFDVNPNCYFQCIPGEKTPNNSLFFGEATCYRWVIQDITVFNVFGQIGICTGILGAFGFFFQCFLALSIYVFEAPEQKNRQGCSCVCFNPYSCSCGKMWTCGPFQRPWLAYCYIGLYILIFPVGITATFIILPSFKQGVTNFTYIVAFTLFFLSLPAVMLASLDVSTAAEGDDDVNHKTEVKNKKNTVSPSTSNQTKVVAVEPRTFSNLPIKTKTVDNTVTVASSSNA